eukprot:GEZU01011796.1.p1 GENE.GEZU01011796.1~~GEZU01011796.1.p1  ORF type:complete len:231 (-),score=43.52 GEZU01011796.1:620-1312(-)
MDFSPILTKPPITEEEQLRIQQALLTQDELALYNVATTSEGKRSSPSQLLGTSGDSPDSISNNDLIGRRMANALNSPKSNNNSTTTAININNSAAGTRPNNNYLSKSLGNIDSMRQRYYRSLNLSPKAPKQIKNSEVTGNSADEDENDSIESTATGSSSSKPIPIAAKTIHSEQAETRLPWRQVRWADEGQTAGAQIEPDSGKFVPPHLLTDRSCFSVYQQRRKYINFVD